jgi:DNA-directed RNA polymerase specialized sigma24 family protein
MSMDGYRDYGGTGLGCAEKAFVACVMYQEGLESYDKALALCYPLVAYWTRRLARTRHDLEDVIQESTLLWASALGKHYVDSTASVGQFIMFVRQTCRFAFLKHLDREKRHDHKVAWLSDEVDTRAEYSHQCLYAHIDRGLHAEQVHAALLPRVISMSRYPKYAKVIASMVRCIRAGKNLQLVLRAQSVPVKDWDWLHQHVVLNMRRAQRDLWMGAGEVS